jgi:Cu/Zn superoxide dismutase
VSFRIRFILPAVLLAGALAGGCGVSSPDGESVADLPSVAMAELEFPEVYSALGSATFTGYPDGVKMMVDVTGIKAGIYSVRIMEIGTCSPFELGLPDEVEAGVIEGSRDVGSLEVAESGHGRVEAFVPEITVIREPDAVVGRTVALFELSDRGEPGRRHACGPIRLMPVPEPGDVVTD